jgi:hypothetical protein
MDQHFFKHLLTVRLALAKTLIKLLKKAYGGSMPSLSRIARDLALRSPNLPQVSNETIRKWLIGRSIPSAIAILALADWLGSEILVPLMSKRPLDDKKRNKPNDQSNDSVGLDAWIELNTQRSSQPGDLQPFSNQGVVEMLQKLSTDNHGLVVSLINALSAKQL